MTGPAPWTPWKVELRVVDEGLMTAEQLWRAVNAGERVDKPVVAGEVPASVMLATAEVSGLGVDLFVLFGRGQTHCLNRSTTDAKRLFAHWRGFNP